MTDTPNPRVTPADTDPKAAAQCLRMARFIEHQEAILDEKVHALADAAGWHVDDVWDWIECAAGAPVSEIPATTTDEESTP